jgi:hypothetical protein
VAGARNTFSAGFLIALLLACLSSPGVAHASHDNGPALCTSKFEGTFQHLHDFPLYRNGPGTKQLGRVTVSYQWQDSRNTYRVCTTTIRRYHSNPQDTWAWVQRNGAFYRIDRGPFYRYAGPVVGAMKRGQKINGGGRVKGACASFAVTWPAGSRPQLNGGGCS